MSAAAKRTVLVLGGSGVFGSRLADRLARIDGITLVVAGRSLERAEQTASQLRRIRPGVSILARAVSAPEGLVDALSSTGAGILVDASGPFQGRGYAIPEICIAAGVNYVDLADGRDFVWGIDALDPAARRAGVAVVSGASSVPGLSSSVVIDLARDMERLRTVAIGIAPANRQPRGPAVMAAVLDYAGKPIPVLRRGAWSTRHGWQGLRWQPFPRKAMAGIPPRFYSHCDVPDLALFPDRWPDVEDVSFQAGLELWPLQLAIWLLSWGVRGRLLSSLRPLAPVAAGLARWTERLGTDRGALCVVVTGEGRDGRAVARSWTVIARQGHGPWLPTLPAAAVVRQLLEGGLCRCAAAPCVGLVGLDAILREGDDLALEIRANELA